MRKRRTIVFIGLAIGILIAVIALLPASRPPPVVAAAAGRGKYDDGSVGFIFAVTNIGARAMEVMVARTDPPVAGYAYRIHTRMQPKATWYPALYPPPEGVPWSVEVLYLAPPGKLEQSLRAVGSRLRLCDPPGSQWKRAQRIEIQR